MKIKVGLIGFGRMGQMYWEEMQKSGRWDIAYICDTDPDSRELASLSAALLFVAEQRNDHTRSRSSYALLRCLTPALKA